jgi:hypothetical protein
MEEHIFVIVNGLRVKIRMSYHIHDDGHRSRINLR